MVELFTFFVLYSLSCLVQVFLNPFQPQTGTGTRSYSEQTRLCITGGGSSIPIFDAGTSGPS